MNYKKFIYKSLSFIPDKLYLKLMYFFKMHSKLNLKNPQTFNEKLQWLKLYDRNPKYSIMVDKHLAKDYVKEKLGNQYIIPTLGIYNKFEDINFKKLPNQFVIKCSHDSAGIVICKDKANLNINEARKKIQEALSYNYYLSGREWPYKNVKPKIIIEKYMEDKKTKELRDYKFFCFNGKVKFFKIDFDRHTNHRANYYNINGEIQPYGEKMCPPDYNRKIDLPVNLKQMIILAEKLSIQIPFVRVDFYEINQKIFFGELTFYPAAGFGIFTDKEWDRKIGDLMSINIK